jgi:hypothetical protein
VKTSSITSSVAPPPSGPGVNTKPLSPDGRSAASPATSTAPASAPRPSPPKTPHKSPAATANCSCARPLKRPLRPGPNPRRTRRAQHEPTAPGNKSATLPMAPNRNFHFRPQKGEPTEGLLLVFLQPGFLLFRCASFMQKFLLYSMAEKLSRISPRARGRSRGLGTGWGARGQGWSVDQSRDIRASKEERAIGPRRKPNQNQNQNETKSAQSKSFDEQLNQRPGHDNQRRSSDNNANQRLALQRTITVSYVKSRGKGGWG